MHVGCTFYLLWPLIVLDARAGSARQRTPERRIRYATGFLGMAPMDQIDNPDSEVFVPLEDRTEKEKARFFNRASRKQNERLVIWD